ncbi:hypothetical protein SLEP1_g53481 [Rubroshorea leprosula]|uniref:Uncharacterized protein n=1 Tax=Rubroshorea leprosula TaxID=152421 RepID=A0AAV5MBB3_9ROSI|nr:hypothetical protein SLEP1_g53481 [Rubroshorea leprosula]
MAVVGGVILKSFWGIFVPFSGQAWSSIEYIVLDGACEDVTVVWRVDAEGRAIIEDVLKIVLGALELGLKAPI